MKDVAVSRRTWSRRLGRSGILACALLAGCQKPNPPLIPTDRAAAVAAVPGPNADRMAANTADELVILWGEALRRRAREDLKATIGAYWPSPRPGRAAPTPAAFAPYREPAVDCSVDSRDGTICTLTLTPAGLSTSSPDLRAALAAAPVIAAPPGLAAREVATEAAVDAATDAAGRHGVVFVRYGIDDGTVPNVRALPDPRPLPESGALKVTTGIDGKVTAGLLGALPADCRTETPAGAASQRRTCTMEYGPFLVSVSREAGMTSPALTDLSADPELMRDMRDAASVLASALLRSPPLQHVLPPPRLANDPAAMMAVITMGMPDQSADVRALIAKNAPRTPWHDVASQGDFDTLCRAAAAAGRPILLMTVSPSQVANHLLYTDDLAPFADHAMLAVVQMSPDGQENRWAHAFARAIGAGDFGALTATDRPRVHGDRCEVGRVYQSPWDKASPRAAIEALTTGRPPRPAPSQPG